jgi:TolB protein
MREVRLRPRLAAGALACLAAALWLAPAHATFPGANGRIVFSSDRDGRSEIYSMNPDGSGQTRLTTGQGDSPAVSRDGRRIAFQSTRTGFSEIYVMNADGTGQTDLTNAGADDRDPAWSADGTRIAFMRNTGTTAEIIVMSAADGSGEVNLTNTADNELAPSYSPDGSRITYVRNVDGVNLEVWVMNADGGAPANLTNNPANDQTPSFSPDGSKIAFASNRDGNNDIYVMNADGTSPTRLTSDPADDTAPVFSPDGSKIAFSSDRAGNAEIHVMNVDGSGVANLTGNPARDTLPDWGVVATGPVPASAPGAAPVTGAPSAPRPILGRAGVSSLVSGRVGIRLPGRGSFASLRRSVTTLPVGTEIDATQGRLALSFARPGGGTQAATFHDGRFKIARQLPDGLVRLALTEQLAGCSQRATASVRRKKVRRLWGKGKGRFQTTGRFAAATVRGTEWLTEDTCTATAIAVRSGVVAVRDRVRNRTITVRAGRKYVARAPKR